ncbi:MAG: hypothetical protein KME27_04655 [Lyngbya sp. HA4199-MV5]|jgi:hypothetical protein|nr:hypothetical protein [Lyngbya sp. HA4199-MV5]
MTTCPLCSDILLRHLRSGKPYWLCRRCRVEILEKKDSTEKIYPRHEVSPHTLPRPMPTHHAVVRLAALEQESSVGRTQRQQPPIKTDIEHG